MSDKDLCLGDCPFLDTMELLSRRYALCVLWSLQHESPKRFGAIKQDLSVNPVTLTQRLKEFEAAGIVERSAYKEIPPRVDYALTPKGADLLPILDTLQAWSETWTPPEDPAKEAAAAPRPA